MTKVNIDRLLEKMSTISLDSTFEKHAKVFLKEANGNTEMKPNPEVKPEDVGMEDGEKAPIELPVKEVPDKDLSDTGRGKPAMESTKYDRVSTKEFLSRLDELKKIKPKVSEAKMSVDYMRSITTACKKAKQAMKDGDYEAAKSALEDVADDATDAAKATTKMKREADQKAEAEKEKTSEARKSFSPEDVKGSYDRSVVDNFLFGIKRSWEKAFKELKTNTSYSEEKIRKLLFNAFEKFTSGPDLGESKTNEVKQYKDTVTVDGAPHLVLSRDEEGVWITKDGVNMEMIPHGEIQGGKDVEEADDKRYEKDKGEKVADVGPPSDPIEDAVKALLKALPVEKVRQIAKEYAEDMTEGYGDDTKEVYKVMYTEDGESKEERVMAFDEKDAMRMINKQKGREAVSAKKVKSKYEGKQPSFASDDEDSQQKKLLEDEEDNKEIRK